MTNDENKEAINFLFEDEARQQRRFREADERVREREEYERKALPTLRPSGRDTLPLWLR